MRVPRKRDKMSRPSQGGLLTETGGRVGPAPAPADGATTGARPVPALKA